jgi:hypothetical protein
VTTHKLVLPENFCEYASEVESKGWFPGAVLVHLDKRYHLTFYAPVRLEQTIEDELQKRPCFAEPNLLVVGSVTEGAMRAAADYAVTSGLVETFVSEK